MRFIFFLLFSTCAMPDKPHHHPEKVIFNFTKDTPAGSWKTENDTVMGGVSTSDFVITDDGHGRFSGHVSLKNNGGFASVVHRLDEPISVEGKSSFQLRVKGDGKDYTFRVKADAGQRHWHQAKFSTKKSEEWETVAIPFTALEARFRGRDVDAPGFAGERVAAMQLLIGNKKEEDFLIEVDVVEAL